MKNRLLELLSEIDVISSVVKDSTDMEMKQTWKPTTCKSAKHTAWTLEIHKPILEYIRKSISMKTSLATIRGQSTTWSHCEIVSPTNRVNLSEHRNWKPWTDCKSNKMLDILGIPKILESLGSLGILGTLEPWEPCGTLKNLQEVLEPAGIRNPAETSGTQEPCGTLGFLRRGFE